MLFQHSPLELDIIPTDQSLSFQNFRSDQTGLPLPPHPGAFGVVRKNHTHEGVDLYAANGSPVYAVADGTVTGIEAFTGTYAGSPWWHETFAVHIYNGTYTIVYGEIIADRNLVPGSKVKAGQCIGHIQQVLKNDKGRPMSMLHLEMYKGRINQTVEWLTDAPRPAALLDPTPYFLEFLKKSNHKK